mmetsp:Transcript_6051/g.17100  ORF Transcript_6051/g.17100 Transcript_6051/m.17100 type:complete len:257 (-) Transcript_6051:103-873(-)
MFRTLLFSARRVWSEGIRSSGTGVQARRLALPVLAAGAGVLLYRSVELPRLPPLTTNLAWAAELEAAKLPVGAEELRRLREGNARYVAAQESVTTAVENRGDLVDGQHPFAVIVTCADSRVPPELIFGAGLGEIFVVRVAGNIADYATIASVEFAVSQLAAKLVVVMGHQNCGAVIGARTGGSAGLNLNKLFAHIMPALEGSTPDTPLADIIRRNAVVSVQDFTNQSTILSEAVRNNKTTFVSAYYNLDSGKVEFF